MLDPASNFTSTLSTRDRPGSAYTNDSDNEYKIKKYGKSKEIKTAKSR